MAPTLDEEAEGFALSRRNLQILLFCIGFIFPFAWFVAAFLPLPSRPMLSNEGTPSQLNVAQNLHKALDQVDEARYENTRWWRNVNRLMSIVGLLVIGAIIALAIVAVRMRNRN